MPRIVQEVHTFSQSDLEKIAKTNAKLQIIASFYRGEFKSQTVKWSADNSTLTVFTTHEME